MDLPPEEPPQPSGDRFPTPAPATDPAKAQEPPASPGGSHARGGIQGGVRSEFILRALPALLVLAFSALIITAQPWLPRPADEETLPALAPEAPVKDVGLPGQEELKVRPLFELLGWVFRNPLVQISMLACGCMALGWARSPRLQRQWRIGFVMPRPAASIHFLDLLALLAVFRAVAPCLAWGLVHVTPAGWWRPHLGWWEARDAAGVAFNLLAQFAGYGIAIAVALWLARQRDGAGGTEGIWPFWSVRGAVCARDVWGDIGLGLAFYGLFLWLIALAAFVNLYALWHLGWEKADQNPLLVVMTREAAGPGRYALLALLGLSAAIGAAFFEELIFRGVLYGVLKRHLGRWPGAIAAALIFSLIHFVHSNILPLFILALLLTWLYERTGRLLAPMVLHSINNTMAIAITLIQVSQAN